MNCFVTGASGFIGANLVHELVAREHEVKALLRPGSDLRGLRGAEFERVEGDLSDAAKLKEAMRGCDWCFHVAASYHLWLRDYRPMYAANVEGTRNVIEAAARGRLLADRLYEHGGLHRLAEAGRRAGLFRRTKPRRFPRAQMRNHYKRSKWQAEQVAIRMAREGLPVIIVNPSAPVGPRDVKPTPTGQVIVDFLNRKMPAYLDTGLNWVHVRDVAIGHILAAEKGRIGERYILGNAEGNWTMKQAFAVLEELTGVRAPEIPDSLLAWRWARRMPTRRFRCSRADRPKRRWPGCAWPGTRCILTPPKRFANWVCRKRRPGRHWRTPRSGFGRMDM